MWSDRYNYYNIQSDQFYTHKVETKLVCDILLKTNCFIQKDHQTFSNADNFPWAHIVLVETEDGNFATSDTEIKFVTLIAIVCSKGQNTDQTIYLNILSKIAKALNWKLYLEADDDENENIEINYE